MTLRRRLLRSILTIAMVTAVAGAGTYAAFGSTTTSAGNAIQAGTVAIGDNDAGQVPLALDAAIPGATSSGCIRVLYTGSLPAGVRVYAVTTGTLAPYLTLTITRGSDATPSYPSCASFTADAPDYVGAGTGIVYQGTLAALGSSWATGLVDAPSATQTWTTNEAHAYRVSVTLASNVAAQGRSGTAAFTFEAQNT